ncbi:hypothetical protein [Streptomyces mirabilis]
MARPRPVREVYRVLEDVHTPTGRRIRDPAHRMRWILVHPTAVGEKVTAQAGAIAAKRRLTACPRGTITTDEHDTPPWPGTPTRSPPGGRPTA